MSRAKCLPAFVLIMIGVLWVPESHAQGLTLDKCHCWNDLNETLRERLKEFSTEPDPPDYQYYGIKPISGNPFGPCYCEDVTRVKTELKIQNEIIYEMLINGSDYAKTNLTNSIEILFGTEDTEYLVIRSQTKIEYVTNGTSPETTWILEAIVRGHHDDAHKTVEDMFKNHTKQANDGQTFILPGVGPIFGASLSFSIVKCNGHPLDDPDNGKRMWPGDFNYPGVVVNYTCNDGFFISDPELAYIECSHENLTWSDPAINITCKKGCQDDPPPSPFFGTRNWNSKLREDGDQAIYTCMDDYRSRDGTNGTSTCDGDEAKWSNIDEKFKCVQVKCPVAIPQVPSWGLVDWDGTTFIKTRIKYTCQENYAPTVKGDIIVVCDKQGKWTPYPKNFKCINFDIALKRGYLSDTSNTYDYYSDQVDRKPLPVAYISYFSVVTMPCMAAMFLVIFMCLCVTRVNSWLYRLCRGDTKNANYALDSHS